MTKFSLYIDDCGTLGTSDKFQPYALGGFVVKNEDEEPAREMLRQFKDDWKISREVPMHGADIRSGYADFAWLKELDKEEEVRFKTELSRLLAKMPIVTQACVVHKSNYHARYDEKYGKDIWNIRVSAVAILLERSVKLVKHMGGSFLRVCVEHTGTRENNFIKRTFKNFRETGCPFNPSTSSKYNPADAGLLQQFLDEKPVIRGKENEMLQIADMVLFYLATHDKESPGYLWGLLNEQRKIADVVAGNFAEEFGVKYYCFGDTENTTSPSKAGGA